MTPHVGRHGPVSSPRHVSGHDPGEWPIAPRGGRGWASESGYVPMCMVRAYLGGRHAPGLGLAEVLLGHMLDMLDQWELMAIWACYAHLRPERKAVRSSKARTSAYDPRANHLQTSADVHMTLGVIGCVPGKPVTVPWDMVWNYPGKWPTAPPGGRGWASGCGYVPMGIVRAYLGGRRAPGLGLASGPSRPRCTRDLHTCIGRPKTWHTTWYSPHGSAVQLHATSP